MQLKAVKLFDSFLAPERSCGVLPCDGHGSSLYHGTVLQMTSWWWNGTQKKCKCWPNSGGCT